MIVCRVIGQAVATVKTDSLRAVSLMLVRPADNSGAETGDAFVAVDTVGAGDGELVLVAQGSAAELTDSPFVVAAYLGAPVEETS